MCEDFLWLNALAKDASINYVSQPRTRILKYWFKMEGQWGTKNQ